MVKKLIKVLLVSGIVCLLGVIPAVARQYKYVDLDTCEIGSVEIERFNEAPELRTKVAAGELPPVEKRLPEEPLVVKPIEEIGQYGGIWYDAWMGAKDRGSSWYSMRETLITWNNDFTGYLPDVAKDWKVSEDGKTYTFYLRKGMKWSDGAPFTADDFVFWYEDIILNDELTPVKPGWLMAGGELGKLEKIDDYTIKFSFAAPYGTFLDLHYRQPVPAAPKHYLKRFHPKYTSMDEIKKAMEKEGYDRWADLFAYIAGGVGGQPYYNTPGTPQITAWIAQNTLDKPIFILTRNPYYWKVDTEGNQLPYIDRQERILTPTTEGILLKCLAGEVTHQYYRIGSNRGYYPILMENQKKGNYHLVLFGLYSKGGSNTGTIFFNYHHKDPVLRKLFLNKKFRIALSLAINREEINQLLYFGEARVSQFSGGNGGGLPYWEEKFIKVYTEYDTERANKILDEIGLEWDKNHEYRLRPHGKRLRIVDLTITPWPDELVEMQELIKGYWKKIGVEIVVKPVDSALWNSRLSAADYDILAGSSCFGLEGQPPIVRNEFFPHSNRSPVAPLWGLWIGTNGKEGEEPPEAMKRIAKIADEIKATSSIEKRTALAKEAFKIHAENLWMIGTVEPSFKTQYRIDSNVLRNDSPKWSVYPYISSSWYIKK